MALHTIVEHDTTHIKPYIDNVKQALSDEVNYSANTGVKNIMPVRLSQVRTSATISFTRNTNNSISVSSGTATGNATCFIENPNGDATILKASLVISEWFDRNKEYTAFVSDTDKNVAFRAELFKSDGSTMVAGGAFLFDTTTHQTFKISELDTNNEAVYIRLYLRVAKDLTIAANTVVYPMICDAAITDLSFQPFTKPNTELTKDTEGLIENVENMGALNLSNNTAASTTMFNGSLTVIRNADGTYTLNGNSTGAAAAEYYPLSEYFEVEQGETYTISSGVTNDSYNTQRLWVDGTPFPSGYRLVSDAIEASDTRNTQVAQSTGTVRVVLYIYPNQTYSNVKIKPMVIKGKSKVFDYAPYAMSNGELTEKVDGVDYEIQYNGAYFHVIKYGDYYHCYSNSNFTSEPSIDNWTTIGSVPNSTNRDFCGILIMNNGVILKVRIKADGDVQLFKVSGTFGSNLYIQCSCVLA